MANMDSVKIVFLVDSKTASGNRDNGYDCERTSTVIRLAVLKLLSNFSYTEHGKVNDKMRWGYRVFDSAKECQIYKKRSVWLQHTHRNFKEFENHLEEEVKCRIDKKLKEKDRRTTPVFVRQRDAAASPSGSVRRSSDSEKQWTNTPGASDGSRVARAGGQHHQHHACNGNGDNDIDDHDDASSAYSLRYALQDIMNDFQWEEPDMCSPTKQARPTRSSRHRTKKLDTIQTSARRSNVTSSLVSPGCHKRKQKMVFLVMECPPNMTNLEEFVGDATKLESVPALRDTIITKEFVANFCVAQDASLFWLNTNLESQMEATQELLSRLFSSVGGNVISLRGLLSTPGHVTSCLHSISAAQQDLARKGDSSASNDGNMLEKTEQQSAANKKTKVPRSFFPLSTIIDHYLLERVEDTPSAEHAFVLNQAVLCSRGATGQSRHCMLVLTPLCNEESQTDAERQRASSDAPQTFAIHNTEEPQSAPRPTTRAKSHSNLTDQCRTFTLGGDDRHSCPPPPPPPPPATSMPAPPSPGSRPSESVTATATITAKIRRDQLELDAFDSSRTFSCIGYDLAIPSADPSAHGNNACSRTHRLSCWFRSAMLNLSKKSLALVLEFTSADCLTSLAVLEPLTPSMASIRLLHPRTVLPLASLVAFQYPEDASRRKERSDDTPEMGRLHRFIESSAKKIVAGHKAERSIGERAKRQELPTCGPPGDRTTSEELGLIQKAVHGPFNMSWLEPWHITAPSRNSCDQIVEQIFSVPDERPSPQVEQLQQDFYRYVNSLMTAEKKTPSLKTTPSKSKAEGPKDKTILKDAPAVRQSPRLKRMKSMPSYVGARTARIMAASRELRASRPRSPGDRDRDRKGKALLRSRRTVMAPIQLPDFESVEAVLTYLQESYQEVLTKSACPVQFTQSTVALVLHFYKTTDQALDQKESVTQMRTLISDALLVTSKQLRERYTKLDDHDDPAKKEVRVQEVEMQTLLRLEMESADPTDLSVHQKERGKDREGEEEQEKEEEEEEEAGDLPEALQDTVDEIVLMLNTVPFLASNDKLTTFLTEVLMANYAETIPDMLRAIYDGLMRPVPPTLMSPSSDITSVQSVKLPSSFRSVSSSGSHNALGSNSNRGRSLVRHPSLADMGTKRIIGVPARRLQNDKKKTDGVEKKKKVKKEEQENEAKLVRRNLFTDEVSEQPKLSRRKSVAVMETQGLRRSPRKPQRTAPLVLKTRVVKETPGKKQVLRAMLNKLDRARKRGKSHEGATPAPSSMLVIEESPEKPLGNSAVRPDTRRSPRISKLTRRPSFYRKQEMHRAKLLGARIAGISPPAISITGPAEQTQGIGSAGKAKKELSPGRCFFSAIISPTPLPAGKAESATKDTDSPSRNTRSRATPVKALMDRLGDGPCDEGESLSATRTTTPRAKTRRSLHAELLVGEGKVNQTLAGKSPFKSPFKSPGKLPGRVPEVVVHQSPEVQQDKGNSSAALDNRSDRATEVIDDLSKKASTSDSETRKRRTSRKVSRKIILDNIESTESGGSSLEGNRSGDEYVKPLTGDIDTTSKISNVNPNALESDFIAASRVRDTSERDSLTLDKGEKSTIEVGQKVEEEQQHPSEANMESEDKVKHSNREDFSGQKRKRDVNEELSTPISKQVRTRRDTCTPPSVPASSCTTPEVINSWPRKKSRYNTPSPCTSKSLGPIGISPIVGRSDVPVNWASPELRRKTTPQSASKRKSTPVSSGRKRKRKSPRTSASKQKRPRVGSSSTTKKSPRARGSLLNLLTSRANLEEGCVSPVFGKPAVSPLASSAISQADNDGMEETLSPRKRTQRVNKDQKMKQAEDFLDDLDRSFSPIFGKSGVTDSSVLMSPCDSDSRPDEHKEMLISDQGLDCDVESDPEIDFPKIKSKSSIGSGGSLSDNEMLMMDESAELAGETGLIDTRHLRRSSLENCSDVHSSARRMQKKRSAELRSANARSENDHNARDQKKQKSDDIQGVESERNSKELVHHDSRDAVPPKGSPLEKREMRHTPVKSIASSSRIVSEDSRRHANPRSPSQPETLKAVEDTENTRPASQQQPVKRKKRVTLVDRIPSLRGPRRSTPTRLSMTLKRPSAGEDWMVTQSPEPAGMLGTSAATGDLSLTGSSSVSSVDDDVFDASLASSPSANGVACTPPAQSGGKPTFVTTPLSASGLYCLINSPLVASSRARKTSSGTTPRSSRASRRQNLSQN